jgi:hypothetical protein
MKQAEAGKKRISCSIGEIIYADCLKPKLQTLIRQIYTKAKTKDWAIEVAMKFELELRKRNIPNDDLIQDVKEVAKKIERNTVTMAEYECFGKYHTSTLQRRFKSWFNVLDKAGMQASRSSLNITEEDLFENIKDIWISLGRQPKYDEIKKPISRYSVKTYENRFG